MSDAAWIAAWFVHYDVRDTFVVYRRITLSARRHHAPFSKTSRGKARREERRFRIKDKSTWLDANNHGARYVRHHTEN